MTPSVHGITPHADFAKQLELLVSGCFASRLFAKDTTLWGTEAAVEAGVRLGWTDFEDAAASIIAEAEALRAVFAAEGVDQYVLCGMGGSSLAPMVIAPSLRVLDSTHPDSVRRALSGDLSRTAVVVSSKSGATIETLSHRVAFEEAFALQGIDATQRIVVVTDPGSALERLANESGMRCLHADPHTGGRFSALTAFGLVPAVLAGADGAALVEDASAVRQLLSEDSPSNPALVLAAIIAAALPQQFVLELHSDTTLPGTLGMWIEQLIAESTGKSGKGILPIAHPYGTEGAAHYSEVAERVQLTTKSVAAESGITVSGTLGEQFLLWEVATAALGALLAVDPFTQPDVESAKVAARQMIGAPEIHSDLTPTVEEVVSSLVSAAPVHSYLAIQAYVDSKDESVAPLLESLRSKLLDELHLPVALGIGPRYLHSTGQLHKGGPVGGMFLQLIDTGAVDQSIPGEDGSFGELMLAQAQGDANVLRERGREVVTVRSAHIVDYLHALVALI
ncbi:MAG: glucose-6-phosphate isomerase [Leucobacter sp.]